MSQKQNLKASGLYTNTNSLGSVPAGALLEASNIVIDKDDVIESRRGNKVYGDALGSLAANRAKQLMVYRETLLRHYNDVLQYDSSVTPGTFTTYLENKWIYATAGGLTRTLSTATFNTSRPHGLVSGDQVEISGATQTEYNGLFTVIVTTTTQFTYTVSGTPATPATGDPLLECSTAHIDQVNSDNKIRGIESFNSNFYFTSDTGIKKLDTIDACIVHAGGIKALDMSVTSINAVAGGWLNGNSAVAYRGVWGIKDANNNLILGSPSSRLVVTQSAGGSYTVTLEVTVPQEVTTNHFFQLYRTPQVTPSTTDPGDEEQLVYEANPTAAEIQNELLSITDITPDSFLGASLYTNPREETIDQSNEPPPFATDITIFKNIAFYSNTKTKHKKIISLLGITGLSGTTITIAGTTYTFGATEIISGAGSPQVQVFTGGTSAQNVDDTARSLVRVINRYANNTLVYAYYLSGPDDVPGQMLIEAIDLNTSSFTIVESSSSIGSTNFSPSIASPITSEDEEVLNRLYFSKNEQFEAVPITNFFDLGSGSKKILRILALRDSLLVLKEDGVFRVSGDTPDSLVPITLDGSTEVVAPETAQVSNNQILALSNQGVVAISDTGVEIISRYIENQILPFLSKTDLATMAFAVSYQTDRKYILFMPTANDDTVATIAFVFNTLTRSWVDWDLSKTCGVVNNGTNKLYLGASDINNLEIERKSFDRTDFADREYTRTVVIFDSVTGLMTLDALTNIEVGDVLVQTQTHTHPNPAYMTSYTIQVEAKILEIVNRETNQILVDCPYDFELATLTHYKAFECAVRWAPEMSGDSGTLKHYREATLRFNKSRITSPILGFSSDIQKGKEEVELVGPGLGTFGYFPWSTVSWSGNLRQRGFRTYLPTGKQRCSITNESFNHMVARELWQIEGLTLTFEYISPRINR